MALALDVRELSVAYRAGRSRVRALDAVSLQVPRGHRMAVVGESGSGKSTLGLAVMGLLPANSSFDAGHVEVDGIGVDLRDDRQMRSIRGHRVSMVFQDAKASLDPVRTVGSQIAEALRIHRIVPRREVGAEVERLLAAVEISHPASAARQYPHELSGGMRQRAMIASALAGRPALLIADEPTSALDVTTQATVIDLIRRLGRESTMSTLLITHDLALVAGFADSVTVMYAGRIVEIGDVERLYRAPAHPYTRALLESIPNLFEARAQRLGSIPGGLPDLSQELVGCRFEPRCPVGHGRPECVASDPVLSTTTDEGMVACHFPGELAVARDVAPPTVRRAGTIASDVPAAVLTSIVKSFASRSRQRGRRMRTIAVNDVDLVIGAGESVGVVGESGSGKTTLARVFVGLESPDSGVTSIPVDGKLSPVPRLPKDYVQFVFQDPGDSLDPLMSVAAIVAEPLTLRDGGRTSRYRTRVAELLEAVGLRADMAERRPIELSGGQRQRVAIARALSTQPQVIIADEAVASLDMSARGQILNLFGRLQAEHGFAYLYISHDLSMVRHVCDRVVVMYSGEVVETASTDDLFTRPRHPYTQTLIAAVPIPDPTFERQRADIDIDSDAAADVASGGCSFRHRCPLARDRCTTERPRLGSDGVACHFADEAAARYDPQSGPAGAEARSGV